MGIKSTDYIRNFNIRQLNLSRFQAGFTYYAAELIQATFRFQADFKFNLLSIICCYNDLILYLASLNKISLSL